MKTRKSRSTLIKLMGLLLTFTSLPALTKETIRIAIGTQDTTINCATGGLVIRELKLLEKYLPRDGRYKDVEYDIQWKNFTSGAPLTNEMIADKLDIGSMADFPGSLNAAGFKQAGKRSIFLTVLSGSTIGSGNGVVVPLDSPVQSFEQLKGKEISVPFGSTSHGMLLRAIQRHGWDAERDVTIIAQTPEVAGTALQAHKIEAHADFVPFAELFPFRGFARKIYDGAQANQPTFHGSLVNAAYAEKYPEIVVAFLRAAIEADRLVDAEPEKYSELIAKVSGIEAEVNYLFHGPLGLQTRDQSWKPEYRTALQTALDTLRLLKKTDVNISADSFIDDRYIKQAFKLAGKDYDKQLQNYAKLPLVAKDARTGAAITDFNGVAQLWIQGEPLVRHYGSPQSALIDLKALESSGKKARVVYVHDRNTGLKLLGQLAWYARDGKGNISAFLLKDSAAAWAKQNSGSSDNVLDFAGIKAAATAVAAR